MQVCITCSDNAIKFSPENGKIRIETTEKRSKIFVSVKDSGIGIPKEDQKLIFERFYKSDHSRGKDKKGTGLGLAIVKEIIKRTGKTLTSSLPSVSERNLFFPCRKPGSWMKCRRRGASLSIALLRLIM